MELRIHHDTKDQLCITWEQAPTGAKRAWVQERAGDDDWAGTRRYINVVRIDNGRLDGRPSGNPTDFPVHYSEAVTDRDVLIAFVLSIFGATGAPAPSIIDEVL
jgi:hypothetical protein